MIVHSYISGEMMPRSRKQFEEIRENSRKRIMDAALELFANNGYYHTPISAIAKKAGVSTGLMYNYFASKEILLEEIMNEGLHLIEEMMGVLLTMEDPRQQLKFMIDSSFQVIKGEDEHFWWLYFYLMMQPNLPKNVFQLFGSMIEDAFKWISGIFAKLGYENPDLEARIFSALGDGIMLHYYMIGKDTYPIEDVVRYMHKLYQTDK